MFAIAQAVAVDANVRFAFSLIVAFNAWLQREAAVIIGRVEKRIRIADNTQKNLAHDQAGQQPEHDEQKLLLEITGALHSMIEIKSILRVRRPLAAGSADGPSALGAKIASRSIDREFCPHNADGPSALPALSGLVSINNP